MTLNVEELFSIARGEITPEKGVTGVTGVTTSTCTRNRLRLPFVTGVTGYASKPPGLRRLRRLRLENTSFQNDFSEGVAPAYPDDQAEADDKNRAAIRAGITDRFCACGLLATVAIFDPAPNRGGRRWLCRECFNDRTMGAE